MQEVMHAGLAVAGIVLGIALVGCAGQPFTTYETAAERVWDGPKSWLEDWCSQTEEFRAAYAAVLAYRLSPYKITAECPVVVSEQQGGQQQ